MLLVRGADIQACRGDTELRTGVLSTLEAETAAQLSHPNIVPIYNVEERDNLVFFIMAFIAGDNLATRLQKEGAMDPGDVRRILKEELRVDRRQVHSERYD